jgi:hypothetical protein
MYKSNIKTSGHVWEKQNLVTISRQGKMFDEMVCKNCGMKGKRFGFESVEVSEKYNVKNVHSCPKRVPIDIPKRIKVTYCYANGKKFENLLRDSEHDVITPPNGYKNDHTGVWVMGVGEPVKLLTNEFVPINY